MGLRYTKSRTGSHHASFEKTITAVSAEIETLQVVLHLCQAMTCWQETTADPSWAAGQGCHTAGQESFGRQSDTALWAVRVCHCCRSCCLGMLLPLLLGSHEL